MANNRQSGKQAVGSEGRGRAAERQERSPGMRVFVALWPPCEVREALAALAKSMAAKVGRARAVASDNLHLTLAFIGDLEEARIHSIARRLGTFDTAPFDWTIDRIGLFSAARIAWAGGPPDARLSRFAGWTRDALTALSIPFDDRPFVPHVTLLRDVTGAIGPDRRIEPPIVWRCERPVLVRSQPSPTGVRYLPLDPESRQ